MDWTKNLLVLKIAWVQKWIEWKNYLYQKIVWIQKWIG